MDIAYFSTVGYIFCCLFKVLEKNASGIPFWLSVVEIAKLLASVSNTKLWYASMDIKIASPRSLFSVSKSLLAQVDRGNASVSIKARIFVEKSAIHLS